MSPTRLLLMRMLMSMVVFSLMRVLAMRMPRVRMVLRTRTDDARPAHVRMSVRSVSCVMRCFDDVVTELGGVDEELVLGFVVLEFRVGASGRFGDLGRVGDGRGGNDGRCLGRGGGGEERGAVRGSRVGVGVDSLGLRSCCLLVPVRVRVRVSMRVTSMRMSVIGKEEQPNDVRREPRASDSDHQLGIRDLDITEEPRDTLNPNGETECDKEDGIVSCSEHLCPLPAVRVLARRSRVLSEFESLESYDEADYVVEEVERVGEEGEGRYGDTDAELEEEEADVNGEEELHTERTVGRHGCRLVVVQKKDGCCSRGKAGMV